MHTHPRETVKAGGVQECISVGDVKHMHAVLNDVKKHTPNDEIYFGVASYDTMSFWAGDLENKTAEQLHYTVDGKATGLDDIMGHYEKVIEKNNYADKILSKISAGCAAITGSALLLKIAEMGGTIGEKVNTVLNNFDTTTIAGGACFLGFCAFAAVKSVLAKSPEKHNASNAPYMGYKEQLQEI